MVSTEVGTLFYIAHKRGERILGAFAFVLIVMAYIPAVHAAPKSELIEFWDDTESSSAMQINHGPWQEILSTYVDDTHSSGINRFDYAAVTPEDARKLKRYLAYLEKMEPRQLNKAESFAYWMNMFNAILVDRVVDTFQSGSNRAINRIIGGGVRNIGWAKDTVEVAMQEISLNDIEHGILRPIWKDPRVHFAMAACTLGGGNILKTAYNGENNEQLLEEARVKFMEHPRAVRVEGNRIVLNSVFDWYRDDFGSSKNAVLNYVRENTSDEVRQAMRGLSRVSYEYDWDLNSPGN